MEKKQVTLPVLELMNNQQLAYDEIINHKKHFVAISAHRRWGKDVAGLSILTSYAMNVVGTYYYVAPFRKQVNEIIIKGKLYNGMNMLDLIPDEIVVKTDRGNKVKNDDLSITLINGSRIVFIGADNIDGVVGVGATGVVFTEFAMISPLFYKLFRPIVSRAIEDTGKGFMLFISTPRGVNNHFTKLFKKFLPRPEDSDMEKEIKKRWRLMWLPANKTFKPDGTRLLSDRFLEEEKMNMGEEAFEQEYMLKLTFGGRSVWYGKQLDEARKSGRIGTFGFWNGNYYSGHLFRGQQVYVSWDLGVSDSTVLTFAQINPATGKPRVIHSHREWGMTLDYYAKYIKDYCINNGLGHCLNILPHDANQRSIVSYNNSSNWNDKAVKRVDILRDMGLDCFVLDKNELGLEKFRVITRINTVRSNFSEFEFDENTCTSLLECLGGYVKKYNKQTGEYIDVPDHNANNKASDGADSFGYLVLYYEKYLKNKPLHSDYYDIRYEHNY